MKSSSILLGKITDEDTTGEVIDHSKMQFVLSESARGVVIDRDDKVAIQYLSNLGFYKLPGGSIEPGETLNQCLKREMREEVGCEVEITTELGAVLEIKAKTENPHGGIVLSHGFLCRIIGEKGELTLMEDEKEQGAEIVWMTFAEAKQKISANNADYHGQFIWRRELLYLNEAENYLKTNG